MIITLYLFQLVMIALLIVKRFVWVVLLLIPLAVTVVVHRIGSGFLQRSWGVMSMRTAHELDVADAAAAAAPADKQHVQEDVVPASILDREATAAAGGVSTLSKNNHLGRPWDVCGDGGDMDGSSQLSAGQQGSLGPDSEVQPEVQQQRGSLAAAWGEVVIFLIIWQWLVTACDVVAAYVVAGIFNIATSSISLIAVCCTLCQPAVRLCWQVRGKP